RSAERFRTETSSSPALVRSARRRRFTFLHREFSSTTPPAPPRARACSSSSMNGLGPWYGSDSFGTTVSLCSYGAAAIAWGSGRKRGPRWWPCAALLVHAVCGYGWNRGVMIPWLVDPASQGFLGARLRLAQATFVSVAISLAFVLIA